MLHCVQHDSDIGGATHLPDALLEVVQKSVRYRKHAVGAWWITPATPAVTTGAMKCAPTETGYQTHAGAEPL